MVVSRTKRNVKEFKDFAEVIEEKLNVLVADSIKRTINKIRLRMIKLQQLMLPYVASNMTDIAAPRTFPDISLPQPSWPKELSPDYYAKKRREFKRSGHSFKGDSYFYFKGYLQKYFSAKGRANVFSNFGTPTVILTREGQRGSTGVYTQGNSLNIKFFDAKGGKLKGDFKGLKTKIGRIQVDLYPKVKGRLFSGMSMGDYFPAQIAYRLDHYKGGQHREFMPQFMEWWLRVKAREALKGALK